MGRGADPGTHQLDRLIEFIGSSFSERPYLKAKRKGQEEDSVGVGACCVTLAA